MRLRIGVGVTEEWVERALPLLVDVGLVPVQQAVVSGSDGEYVECDFDLRDGAIPVEHVFETLDRVRRIVDDSNVPHPEIRFVG